MKTINNANDNCVILSGEWHIAGLGITCRFGRKGWRQIAVRAVESGKL